MFDPMGRFMTDAKYVCSYCGAAAYYDGRCGDGPVLVCGCDRVRRLKDRIGHADIPTTGARAIPAEEFGSGAGGYPDNWLNR